MHLYISEQIVKYEKILTLYTMKNILVLVMFLTIIYKR